MCVRSAEPDHPWLGLEAEPLGGGQAGQLGEHPSPPLAPEENTCVILWGFRQGHPGQAPNWQLAPAAALGEACNSAIVQNVLMELDADQLIKGRTRPSERGLCFGTFTGPVPSAFPAWRAQGGQDREVWVPAASLSSQLVPMHGGRWGSQGSGTLSLQDCTLPVGSLHHFMEKSPVRKAPTFRLPEEFTFQFLRMDPSAIKVIRDLTANNDNAMGGPDKPFARWGSP